MRHSRIFFLSLFALAGLGLVCWLYTRTPAPASVPAAPLSPPTVSAPLPADTTRPVAATEVATPSMPTASAPSPQSLPDASAVAVVTAVPESQPAQPLIATPASDAQPLPVIDEVAATERMYLAHAPLREPEVADPDSETNRRILETMVTKALAASGSSAPAAN